MIGASAISMYNILLFTADMCAFSIFNTLSVSLFIKMKLQASLTIKSPPFACSLCVRTYATLKRLGRIKLALMYYEVYSQWDTRYAVPPTLANPFASLLLHTRSSLYWSLNTHIEQQQTMIPLKSRNKRIITTLKVWHLFRFHRQKIITSINMTITPMKWTKSSQ